MATSVFDIIGAIADRVAGWEDERADLKSNIDAELAAAKNQGLDAGELRRAIANRRKRNKDPDTYDRKESTRAQYELALGMPSYSGVVDEPAVVRERLRVVPSKDDATETARQEQLARIRARGAGAPNPLGR